jgi:hypothetical protein
VTTSKRSTGVALSYEDLNDHDELRPYAVLLTQVGKLKANRGDCAAVASKSTQNC